VTAPADLGQYAEFRATWPQTWRRIMPMVPSLVLMVLLLWVVGYVLGGPVTSVVAPVVTVGLIIALHRWASRIEVLRMSPDGVELRSRRGSVQRMSWADVEAIADLVVTGRRVPFARGVAGSVAVAGLQGVAAALSGPGLVGWGEHLTVFGKPPTGVRRDAQGRYRVAIGLTEIDRHWQRGKIGAWVGHYRPDLLPGT
jgi:hypothetical protein